MAAGVAEEAAVADAPVAAGRGAEEGQILRVFLVRWRRRRRLDVTSTRRRGDPVDEHAGHLHLGDGAPLTAGLPVALEPRRCPENRPVADDELPGVLSTVGEAAQAVPAAQGAQFAARVCDPADGAVVERHVDVKGHFCRRQNQIADINITVANPRTHTNTVELPNLLRALLVPEERAIFSQIT